MNNEALESEDLDIIELLAKQGQEVDDNDEEEIDAETDDLDTLKERVHKRNQSLNKSKQANKRILEERDAMQKENELLAKRLDQIEAKFSSQPNEGAKQEDSEILKQWRESVDDTPANAIDYANLQNQKTQETMIGVMSDMKAAFEAQLAEIKGEIDPEKVKYRDKISSIKSVPEFSELPDDVLLKVVKAMSANKIPRGSIGGQRAPTSASSDKDLDQQMAAFRKSFNS